MFDQHDRWLEELMLYTGRKELITCTAGRMPLTAIVAEIAEACSDPRVHDRQRSYDWQSMASDLEAALEWIGPELSALVDSTSRAVHTTITADLLVSTKNGALAVDDSQRPAVTAKIAAVTGILSGDLLLVAAWRDLVTACRDIDHTLYPHERVAYLRDTLIAFSELRNQDRRHWSPVSIAARVLLGTEAAVRYARATVGDTVDTATLFDPTAAADRREAELFDLAERCLVQRPSTGTCVVWFRLQPAFVKSVSCVTFGAVTFYDAQTLASALIDHGRARELFEVVPEELLTEEIRELQRSSEVDEVQEFEHVPQLVYARVTVREIEGHRAKETARMYLDTVLAVVDIAPGMWQVLDGTLCFDGSPSYGSAVEWGLKAPLPAAVFSENDTVTRTLREMTAAGHTFTVETARRLQPVLRLQSALLSVPRSDPEAVVMAAVRAIEHCNTWIAPLEKYRWYGFVEQYLFDEYLVTGFANRVAGEVFSAVVQYLPDRSPGARAQPTLRAIRDEITVGGGPAIDSSKALEHVSALKEIYAEHFLVRQLKETDDIVSSSAALRAAFDSERQQLDARVKRLTRSRNAAIHGGALSVVACETVADFALIMGRTALNTVIRALVAGEPVGRYASGQRNEFLQRAENLTQGGDLGNLFRLTP
ncbi:hypothetical protein [Nocardia sp. NPDC020380]|uniref:hypothetical protein n=1 Tax=Nocardia sp. NPDC020380 TaxID=3364309 RepID=UPI0037B84059